MIDNLIMSLLLPILIPIWGVCIVVVCVRAYMAHADNKLRQENPELWMRTKELEAKKGPGIAGKAAGAVGSAVLQSAVKKAFGLK